MTSFYPTLEDRHDLVPVVVRTDYTDDSAWRDVSDELTSVGDALFIQGTQWSGVTVDEVLKAAVLYPALAVIFIADAQTWSASGPSLIAVTTSTPDDEDYEHTISNGRQFRVLPHAVHEVHCGIEMLVRRFPDFAQSATAQPGQVFAGTASHPNASASRLADGSERAADRSGGRRLGHWP
ncbi:DUF6924 domain-containing protein [Actinoplanes solisilvae]|uniref:DUF6924 domain-containing protein n=1 Tax=Actinoplanes solisilvae TaxID=2486853 RepID=UPI000FDAB34A|nr:hypothetical protein [Actinoplanes solisilvae]